MEDPVSTLTSRIFSGQANPVDAQWLQALSRLFDAVSIKTLTSAGMQPYHIKDFVGMLAMAQRVAGDLGLAPPEDEAPPGTETPEDDDVFAL